MVDWVQTTLDALKELQADEILVSGAKLRGRVAPPGSIIGEQFGEFLVAEGVKFVEFVERIPDVIVHRASSGTDALIGYEGATWPVRLTPARPPAQYRPDVYEAFTRMSRVPYYYITDNDLFTQSIGADENSIAIPSVTLNLLIEERKQFAERLEDSDDTAKLIQAMDSDSSPLVAFQKTVMGIGAMNQWNAFKTARLAERLSTWAETNGLKVKQEWQRRESETFPAGSVQVIMSELVSHMTDDEVRGLQVPFRAVESMLRGNQRNH